MDSLQVVIFVWTKPAIYLNDVISSIRNCPASWLKGERDGRAKKIFLGSSQPTLNKSSAPSLENKCTAGIAAINI